MTDESEIIRRCWFEEAASIATLPVVVSDSEVLLRIRLMNISAWLFSFRSLLGAPSCGLIDSAACSECNRFLGDAVPSLETGLSSWVLGLRLGAV